MCVPSSSPLCLLKTQTCLTLLFTKNIFIYWVDPQSEVFNRFVGALPGPAPRVTRRLIQASQNCWDQEALGLEASGCCVLGGDETRGECQMICECLSASRGWGCIHGPESNIMVDRARKRLVWDIKKDLVTLPADELYCIVKVNWQIPVRDT